MNKKTNIGNALCLFLAAMIWGSAFVAQSVGNDYMGSFTFNGVRSIIGAIVLLPVIAVREKKNPVQKCSNRELFKGGILCGIFLCIASNLQQIGIAYTTVGKAGFITALYIIIVPVLGIVIGKKVSVQIWIGIALAAVGLYLLCINGPFVLMKGDILMIMCALVFSLHILVIDHYSPHVDGVKLSCVQFMTCGVISCGIALATEHPEVSMIMAGWKPLFYAGAFSCGIAYTLQVIGQKNVAPSIASLILSMESVFSALSGWIILHETLTGREKAGCIVMFVAIILAQLPQNIMTKRTA